MSYVLHFSLFFFKQKTAYEMRISDWSSDVCSSDLPMPTAVLQTWSGRLTPEEVNFLARGIKDVADEYIRQNLKHTRARKTKRDWEMAVCYFVSLCEKERIGDITETDVDRFRERLLDVPSEIGKGIYEIGRAHV